MGKITLAPSILSADFAHLEGAIQKIVQSSARAVHIDVMDGQFVPEISFGQPLVRAVRRLTELPFDVHLMVAHPENHVDSFAAAGADWITFHVESTVHIHRLIVHIKSLGKKAGIAFVPSTPVSALAEILPFVDVVLVMTVNPGFGGQELIPSCVDKITELARIRREKQLSYMISVDGGVNSQTVESVAAAGADIAVSGSAFFKGELVL
ncbi:MAG: ribulose-phosphate 3-epimerase [Treponema sp.]|nr:ribulose-phosphate 3-epimerase [Treponema sp.]